MLADLITLRNHDACGAGADRREENLDNLVVAAGHSSMTATMTTELTLPSSSSAQKSG